MEGFHVPSTTLNDMKVQSIKEKHSHYLWLLMICSTIGGFLFGYDTVRKQVKIFTYGAVLMVVGIGRHFWSTSFD